MRDPGMVGFVREHLVEDRPRRFLFREVGVLVHRPCRNQRQRMEDGRLPIVGIALMQLAQRVRIAKRPGLVVELAGVAIEGLQCGDIVALALALGASRARFCKRRAALLQLGRARRCPQRMIVARREPPMSDRAIRVGDGGLREDPRSLFIFERMESAEPAVEQPVCVRGAACLERYFADLRSMIVAVPYFLGGGGKRSERDGE